MPFATITAIPRQGSPCSRFERALTTGNLQLIEAAAAELRTVRGRAKQLRVARRLA